MLPPKILIQEFNNIFAKGEEALFIKRLKERGLNNGQIANIILTMYEVCNRCYNNYCPCSCSSFKEK
jgi:hypothetical protein